MVKFIIVGGMVASIGMAGCKTTMPTPVAATPAPTPTPAPVTTTGATNQPAAQPAAATGTSTTTPAVPLGTDIVGDMSDDGNKNIVIANYLAKAITTPFAPSWDANKVFAGLADGSVRSYIAGAYLAGPGWSAAPQEDKFYNKDKSLVSGNLITPIPSDSDIDGGNVAFASKEGGTTWKQVAWSNSTGPHNYSAYYGPADKFKWTGFKLTKR